MSAAQLLGAALIVLPVMAVVVAAGVAMADDLGPKAALVIWAVALVVAGALLLGSA